MKEISRRAVSRQIFIGLAAYAVLACGNANEDSGAGGAGGASEEPRIETIPLLDDERAAEVFAPLADGSCAAQVELHAELLQVVSQPASAGHHSLRVASDPCGGAVVAWENAEGTVTVERFLEPEMLLWSREVRTVASGKARLLNLAVSKNGAVLVFTWDDEGPTLDIFQADGSPVEGTPEPGRALALSSVLELEDGSWWTNAGRVSFPSGKLIERNDSPPAWSVPSYPDALAHPTSLGAWPWSLGVIFLLSVEPSTRPNHVSHDLVLSVSQIDSTTKTPFIEQGPLPVTLSFVTGVLGPPFSSKSRAVFAATRRTYEEFVRDGSVLEWQSEEDTDCTARVTSAYPDFWTWGPRRCDLIEAVHGVRAGFLAIHFERREGAWIPHVSLLDDWGKLRDSVSLEDQIPELDPIHNAVGYYRTSVKSAVSADGKTLLLGGLRATGEGFWVGSFRRADLVACRDDDCPLEFWSEEQ